MKRPIAISLSPNLQKDDFLQAIKQFFNPVYWYDFTKTEILEKEFADYFGRNYYALAVNSGRSALYLILKSLDIGYGDEVIIQSLTCVAVPNSIKWVGAEPVYVDVEKNFNMDPRDLTRKISKNTKAVILQNSFGIPADYDAIKKVLKKSKRKIYLIEDCALSLGAMYKGRKVGVLGDISFFSFGRDKVISSVFGGMILCKDRNTYKSLLKLRENLEYPRPWWLVQQLLHPIIFFLILPFYNFGISKFTLGKFVIFVLQKLHLLSKSIYKEEKFSRKPKVFPTKLPGALSVLALNQLKKLDLFNLHRRNIADFYFRSLKSSRYILPPRVKGAIWVRFPIVAENAEEILKKVKQKGVILGDWYKDCVYPVENLNQVDYIIGSCPYAESIRGKILNLPTYEGIGINEAKYIISLIK